MKPAIDKMLKSHLNTCTMHGFSDLDKRCSCGRDEARIEVENLQAITKAARKAIAKAIDLGLSYDEFDWLADAIGRYDKP